MISETFVHFAILFSLRIDRGFAIANFCHFLNVISRNSFIHFYLFITIMNYFGFFFYLEWIGEPAYGVYRLSGIMSETSEEKPQQIINRRGEHSAVCVLVFEILHF